MWLKVVTENERVDNNVSSTGLRKNFGRCRCWCKVRSFGVAGTSAKCFEPVTARRSCFGFTENICSAHSDGTHKCDSCFGSHPSQPKGGRSCVCLCKGLQRSGLAAGSVIAAVVEEVEASRWQGVVT